MLELGGGVAVRLERNVRRQPNAGHKAVQEQGTQGKPAP